MKKPSTRCQNAAIPSAAIEDSGPAGRNLLFLLFLAPMLLPAAFFPRPYTSAQSTPPTLILTNGVIYTADPVRARAEAVAITGELITGVGSSADILKLAGPQTQFIDLHGAFVVPGFNDAHIHLAGGGQAKLAIDFEGARSLAEFQQRIRARLPDTKPGEWLTGRGWDHTLWPTQKFPTRYDLDAVSRDRPMFFTREDGHVAVANTPALELAGIKADTRDPPGGSIERDNSGDATGMLKESATALVAQKVPPLTPEQRRRGIELALAEAARFGLTSIQDNSSWQDFFIYEQLKKEGKLTLRITEWLPFTAPVAQLEDMRRRGGTTDPWLRTGALKGVADGTLGSRTAAMLAPFADDPSTKGIFRIEPDRMKQLAIERDKAGFQIAIHAIGDAANRAALDAFAAAQAANGTRDSRHRIEHAQVVAPDDFARFAQLGVIASMQPVHESSDMRWAEQRLGTERSKGAYAWRTFLNNKVRLAFGTDFAVEPLNPMRGLYACVTRELPEGGPPGGWQPQEKISIDECISAYTAGSAYVEFMEGKKGQILPGQFADLVVLSADVTKIPPAQILRTEVLRTIVASRSVYSKP